MAGRGTEGASHAIFPRMDNSELNAFAIVGLKAEIARLTGLLASLNGQGDAAAVPVQKRAYVRRKKRVMSAEGRARLSKMMKARWAARRKAKS